MGLIDKKLAIQKAALQSLRGYAHDRMGQELKPADKTPDDATVEVDAGPPELVGNGVEVTAEKPELESSVTRLAPEEELELLRKILAKGDDTETVSSDNF